MELHLIRVSNKSNAFLEISQYWHFRPQFKRNLQPVDDFALVTAAVDFPVSTVTRHVYAGVLQVPSTGNVLGYASITNSASLPYLIRSGMCAVENKLQSNGVNKANNNKSNKSNNNNNKSKSIIKWEKAENSTQAHTHAHVYLHTCMQIRESR